MAFSEQVKKRIEQLIQEAASFQAASDDHSMARCRGYISGALAVVEACCPSGHAFVRQARDIVESAKDSGWIIHERVFDFAELLKRLKADIEDGLLADLETVVVAEAFDDFLDRAVEYQKANRKNEAGTIAAIVFEDTVRRICRKHAIPEKDRPMEDLLNGLNKASILTGTKTKRAKSAAHLRTKASHAQWDEFDMSDVKVTIDLTRELLDTHMQ